MTQFQKSVFKCTNCGNSFEISCARSIKSNDFFSLRKSILDFSIFKYSCPVCKDEYDIEYELLYHNPDQKYMIWFQLPYIKEKYFQYQSPHKMFEIAPKEYKYRIVYSRQELAEKIKIFDAGLDDKTIEFIKLGILTDKKSSPVPIKNVYFYALMSEIDPDEFTDDLGFSLELADLPEEANLIPRIEYVSYRQIMASDFPEFIQDTGEWERVDLHIFSEYSKMKEQGISQIRNKWKDILNYLPKTEASASALLQAAKHISKTGTILQIGYKSNILASKAEKELPVIEQAVRNVLGLNYFVRIVVIE